MTNPATNPADPKLQQLLDVYGADQRRWPAEDVRLFADLAGAEALSAQAALREAAALDQVLARARAVPAGRQQALADRIMAQVQAEADAAAAAKMEAEAGSNVIALPRQAGLSSRSALTAPRRRNADWAGWRAAAALAAALVLGVALGMSGSATTTFEAVAETVGVGLERSVLAFNDEQQGAIAALDDEDVL